MKDIGESDGCMAIRAGAGGSSLRWELDGADSLDSQAVVENGFERHIVVSKPEWIFRDTTRGVLAGDDDKFEDLKTRKEISEYWLQATGGDGAY